MTEAPAIAPMPARNAPVKNIPNIREELLATLSAAELEKLEYRWKQADEDKFGPMPDASTPEGQMAWLSRMHKRLLGFFKANRIVNPTNLRDLVKDCRDIIQARGKYDVDYAFDLAKVGLQLFKEQKGRQLADVWEKDTAMMTKATTVKQHPPVANGKLAAAKVTPDAEATRAAVDFQQTVASIKLDRNMVDQELQYSPFDPGKCREVVWSNWSVKSDDELARQQDFDLTTVKIEYKQAVRRWLDAQKPAEAPVSDAKPSRVLDNTFPRCDIHNEPLNDQGECPLCILVAANEMSASVSPDEPKPEPKDNPWKSFYTQATEWGFSSEEVKAKVFGGVRNMAATGLTPNEAIMKLKAFHFKEKVAEDKPASETSPVAPQNAPLNETATPDVKVPETQKSPETAQTAPSTNERKLRHTEAPYSVNFRMIDPLGIEAQHTVRANTVKEGIEQYEWLTKYLMDHGYTPVNGYARQHTQPTAPASTPATTTNGSTAGHGNPAGVNGTADGGTVNCIAIKVITSYEGGKPQLEFDCDGMEHSLKYTRPVGDMVKLLSKVKQSSGGSFTADDLAIGRKFGGAWKIAWKANEKDGKTYKNVLDVLPA